MNDIIELSIISFDKGNPLSLITDYANDIYTVNIKLKFNWHSEITENQSYLQRSYLSFQKVPKNDLKTDTDETVGKLATPIMKVYK